MEQWHHCTPADTGPNPLVPSSNPTRNRPSKAGHLSFSHYRLPNHVSKNPTNTIMSFPYSTLFSRHQQAITEKVQHMSRSPVTERGMLPASSTGSRCPE